MVTMRSLILFQLLGGRFRSMMSFTVTLKIQKFNNTVIPKIVTLRHNDDDSLVIAETSPLDRRNLNCGQAIPRCPFPKITI